MDAIDEIKQLYYKTTVKTIQSDFARAIDLLKTLPDEASRERVAVYMQGLAEMRKEWRGREAGHGGRGGHRRRERAIRGGDAGPPRKTATPSRKHR